jgi:hypothetical protein
MRIFKQIKNPIYWIIGVTTKLIIRKLFFNKTENKDFNNLISITLDLLPYETLLNVIKLLKNTFYSKPSELFNFAIFNEALTHSLPLEQRLEITSKENKSIKYLFIFLVIGSILKRSLNLIKKIILMPFKLGVYSFIAFLFGVKVDYLLSFFDLFKFNLPT